jgi:serine/threonine protein phosphatase PrpC
MIYGPYSLHSKIIAWLMRRTVTSGVRRVAAASAAIASDVGSVRDENQDRVAIVRAMDKQGRPFILAALADGIGGMKQGAECASMALGHLIEGVIHEAQGSSSPKEWLLRAAHRANVAVHSKFRGSGGSTLVAALISADRVINWLSIGDSRVFHSIGQKLEQLSTDDTIAGQLGKRVDAGRNSSDLLQFVGVGDQLEPHIEQLTHDFAGSLLLTSDGVHFIDPVWLGQIVANAPDPGICARRLIELSKWLGGPDNASVALVGLDFGVNNSEPLFESSFEVWDPFGDLHVVVDRQPFRTPAPITPAVAEEKPESSIIPSAKKPPAESSNPTESAVKPKPKPKAKASKSARKSKTKGKELSQASEDESIVEVPQLRIEFPNKTN